MASPIEVTLDNVDLSVIRSSKDVIKDAENKILKIKKGEEKPIITRYSHLNENLLGGIFSQMIITIAALSGFGKTTILKHIEDDMFDKTLNPDCDNFVLLKCNYEMTSFNLLLRRLKETMKTPMKHILAEDKEFTAMEEATFNDTLKKESHPNIFYIEKPLTSNEWLVNVREFLKQHRDKAKVIVSIDHLGLIKDGGNKKQAMDEVLEYENDLKKEFSNVSFINLSQMNRDLESRTGDPKSHFPKASDLYNSSNIQFISDLVLIINNPFKLSIDKYMFVQTRRYPHLQEYMIDSRRDKTAFETKGNIFWHYVKIRQDDVDPEDDRDVTLQIEPLYKKKKVENSLQMMVEKQPDIPRMDATEDLWGEDIDSPYNPSDDADDCPF